MRKRKVMLVASFMLAAMSNSAMSNSALSEPYFLMGGTRSCAAWLSNGATKNAGDHYITGFWSGLNAFNQNTIMRMTGNHTDNLGTIGEIEKICREKPSMDLQNAVFEIYFRFNKLARPDRR